MEISKKTKKAGMFAVSLCVIASVLASAFICIMKEPILAEPSYPEDHLFVDATYLLKTDETNDSVNITCDIYLTNIWEKESGPIKATAYVIETTNNFAIDKNKVDIGEIKANSTAELGIPVTLSNSSYKIEVLLFENDKLVLKGELIIRATPRYDWDDIVRGEKEGQQWDVENLQAPEFHKVR